MVSFFIARMNAFDSLPISQLAGPVPIPFSPFRTRFFDFLREFEDNGHAKYNDAITSDYTARLFFLSYVDRV